MGRFEKIPEGAPTVSSRTGDFWLHEGIVHGRRRPVSNDIQLMDAIEATDQLRHLTEGQQLPFFFDGRHFEWMQMDTRALVRHRLGEMFSRVAMIVEPHMLGHMSEAMLGVSGAGIPFRIFTDEEEAWKFASSQAS